jgi:hypothetical protein
VYNAANDTDYALLPPENYAIERATITIPANRNTSPGLNIVVSPNGMEINSIYLLPITIRSLNADDRFVIRDSTIYLRFSKMRNLIIIKSQQITNFTDPSQLSYYPRGSYYEFVTTGGDPNINTSPLTESFIDVMTPVRKIVIAFEYQTEKSIGTMEFFYGRPNAAGGESSGGQLMLTRTGGGLDASDNTKWNDFIHDMTFAYSNWGWGAVGHRLRFDIAATAGHRVFVRNMRYMVVEGDID